MRMKLDIAEVLAEPVTHSVLALWWPVRLQREEHPPFSGGVLTDWPALAADGFPVCREEEALIDHFLRWKEESDGPQSPPSR